MLNMLRNTAFLAALLLAHGIASASTPYKIVTASERGTYIQIGRDLAKYIAPAADIDLEVLPSAGSSENMQRLRYEPGVKFALVQSDVYQAYINQGASGYAEAARIIRPLQRDAASVQRGDRLHRARGCAVHLRARDPRREDQRRTAAQRHRDVGNDLVPADVRPPAARTRTFRSCRTKRRRCASSPTNRSTWSWL